MIKIRLCLALALLAVLAGPRLAGAQASLNQDWVLNGPQSNVYMQTEKLENTIEKHRFTSVEGNVTRDGDVTIKIDLNTLDTGIDLRNVRMRFVLFETFKFPYAIITAKIDKSKLTELATRSRINYQLQARVNLHGIVKDFQIPVEVAKVNDTTVTVSTIKPVDVAGDTFDFMRGIGKLSDAMGGIRIVPSAAISFDLTFGSGSAKPALEAARIERDRVKEQESQATISSEGCETRFTVISESNAIYFKTGSAELEPDEPLLDTGADIAKRCPAVNFQVDGHTDNIGGHRFNQRLSAQRAKSVVDYLAAKGVAASRIRSAGYGETRPVAPNDSEANRKKNRRIEFSVRKD
jgi:outer membrane protein OmpA-like peptidoglycan-associated protein/polyisoprenoid-binding protein YceI